MVSPSFVVRPVLICESDARFAFPSSTTMCSPAATFKKGLAKMQAGDYDETAIKAKLDSYISEPAVMFSFTT